MQLDAVAVVLLVDAAVVPWAYQTVRALKVHKLALDRIFLDFLLWKPSIT